MSYLFTSSWSCLWLSEDTCGTGCMRGGGYTHTILCAVSLRHWAFSSCTDGLHSFIYKDFCLLWSGFACASICRMKQGAGRWVGGCPFGQTPWFHFYVLLGLDCFPLCRSVINHTVNLLAADTEQTFPNMQHVLKASHWLDLNTFPSEIRGLAGFIIALLSLVLLSYCCYGHGAHQDSSDAV